MTYSFIIILFSEQFILININYINYFLYWNIVIVV